MVFAASSTLPPRARVSGSWRSVAQLVQPVQFGSTVQMVSRASHRGRAASCPLPNPAAGEGSYATADGEIKDLVIREVADRLAKDRSNCSFCFETIDRRKGGQVVVTGFVRFGESKKTQSLDNPDRFWVELVPDGPNDALRNVQLIIEPA